MGAKTRSAELSVKFVPLLKITVFLVTAAVFLSILDILIPSSGFIIFQTVLQTFGLLVGVIAIFWFSYWFLYPCFFFACFILSWLIRILMKILFYPAEYAYSYMQKIIKEETTEN